MEVNDFERRGYYGGRTEVFDYRFWEQPVYEDINSSYPSIMLNKPVPHPDKWAIIKQNWDSIRESEGISVVRVDVPKMDIPPLPYRTQAGKLLFPYGTWIAAYTHPELRMAEKYGVKIKEVLKTIVYEHTFNPFEEYIRSFHTLKNSSAGLNRNFYKLLLNSLSGKFGEMREETIRINVKTSKMCECGKSSGLTCSKCGGYNLYDVQINSIEGDWISITGGRLPDPKHSFPVIIAYIAAYGRIKLYEERLSKVKTPIYCDTDCCVCEESSGFNTGPELGQWEPEEIYDFQAYAPKFYNCSGKMKLKGVPKKHRMVSEPKQLKFYYEKPLKLAEAIHQKEKPNLWKEVEKIVTFEDSKRRKTKSGTSYPVKINETFL